MLTVATKNSAAESPSMARAGHHTGLPLWGTCGLQRRKRHAAVTRFLDGGGLCISNNAAERELRAIAVGRRNWTLAGSDEGGQRAAALYTLMATRQAQRRRSASLARRHARFACRIIRRGGSTSCCPGNGVDRVDKRPDRAIAVCDDARESSRGRDGPPEDRS
jgi:hypothetical protein